MSLTPQQLQQQAAAHTDGQRQRFRRNAVILAAVRQGLSQRLVADVFGLPPSRVHQIVREFERAPDARA